jgi:outer membrane protein TolC
MTPFHFQRTFCSFLFVTALATLQTGGAETASPSPSTPAVDNSSQANPASSAASSPAPADQQQEKGTGEPVLPSEPPAAGATPTQLIPPATNPTLQPAQNGGTPAASPTPNKAAIAPATEKELDDQFQEALKIHHLRPKRLLALSLTDAVRMALVQNSDLRLAGEDVQSARAALKQATGAFDSKLDIGLGYQRTYLNGGGAGTLTQAQFSQTFQTALGNVLRTLQTNPAAGAGGNLDALIANSFNSAQGQASETAIDNYNADTSLGKKLRNGISTTFTYSPGLENLEGKPTWPPFKHDITVLFQVPITKYGVIANDGAELAAIKDYQGSILTMAHSATKATSNTLAAYWKCVAAIEKFNVADRAYRIADALYSLTNELVKGDAVPATELSLARAKVSETAAGRNAELIDIFNTSKDLASTLGLTEDQLRTLPYADEEFPRLSETQIARLNEDRLIDIALNRRFDRKAALKSVESKRILAEKARIDLRPDFSIGFGGGVELVDDSQAGQGKSGTTANPSFGGAMTFSYAFANNSNEGALLDAQSALNKSLIGLDDVSRGVTLNLRTEIDTLRELVTQIAEDTQAVRYYTQNLSDFREKFRLGAATLIDTIQAEERLNNADSNLIDARSQLAQTVGQLRYESGTILTTDVAYRVPSFPKPTQKVSISRDTFTTLPDLSKEPGPAIQDRYYEPNIKYISGHPPWHH